ncbi:MAG: GDP-mannose 4,6-dehydratase [Nanoarchaeota archaeon]|nr:GDP-mannose 4,6-dehydratase [Nanoarchaeota archaeon]
MTPKILITGASGFIGANLVHRLIKENEIHILVRENSNLWRIKDLLNHPNLKKHIIDILDYEKLKELFKEVTPTIIIHTAIYGGYPYQKDTKKIIETNFNGTVNLLEASKDLEYRWFINTGSSSEYGEKNLPMNESDLLEPNTEYGVAKSAATLYCSHFAKKHKKPIITLRLFSPYGYFEEENRLVPYITKSCLKNKEIQIGNPFAARDFVFIEDVINAYMNVLNSERVFYGEVFNIGSGKQHTIGEVVENILKITGKPQEIKYSEDKKRSFDTSTWVANITKMKEYFEWSPKYSLSEGIEKNIKWFEKNLNMYNLEEIELLKKQTNEMKLKIAKILEKTYGSHIGGDYSILDILNILYSKIMKIDPKNPLMEERDKLIFSKGHNSLALYTVLSNKGFFSEDILQTYCQNNSFLEGHVNFHGVPGVEVSSGSLGHGLAIGIGMAIANKQDKNKGRIFVILGDGECNEGSIWEAAIFASRIKLDNLIVIVDANKFQGYNHTDEIYGDKERLSKLWKATGFEVKEIDGHNYSEIIDTLQNVPFKKDAPSLVLAHTIKGKGISFMENKLEWHYKSPNKEQLKIIEEELK